MAHRHDDCHLKHRQEAPSAAASDEWDELTDSVAYRREKYQRSSTGITPRWSPAGVEEQPTAITITPIAAECGICWFAHWELTSTMRRR